LVNQQQTNNKTRANIGPEFLLIFYPHTTESRMSDAIEIVGDFFILMKTLQRK